MKRRLKKISIMVLLTFLIGLTIPVYGASNAGGDIAQLPLRFLCEAQGAQVSWDAGSKTVTVTKDENTFQYKTDSTRATINGASVELESKPQVVNGRLRMPLPLINRILGTDLAMNDCIETLAVKYMDLLQKDSIDDCISLFSDNLIHAFPAANMKQMEAAVKSLGPISQQGVNIKNDGVHNNATILYSLSMGVQIEFILRFDNIGQLDDISPIISVSPVSYKAPDYDNPADYTEQDVVFGEGNWKLPGTLTMPKGNGPFPVVVLVHGSGPNDRDESIGPLKPFRDLAVGLASENIAVLRFDKRTFAHSFQSTDVPEFTVNDEYIQDSIAAVKFLKSMKDIDSSRIYVLGHSEGAMLVPRIIEASLADIKGAVVMSGPTRTLMDIMPEQYKYLISLGLAAQPQYDAIKAQMDMINDPGFSPANPPKGFAMGVPYYWADLKTYDPAKMAAKQTTPLLILQGQRDYQVTAAQDFQGWKDALSDRTNVTFKLYPKLNHVYTEGEGAMSSPLEYAKQANIPDYVIEDISQWVNETK